MTTKELREKKGSLIHSMEDIKTQASLENRLLNEDESKRFDLLDNDMEKINAEIRRYEKLEAEAVAVAPDNTTDADKYTRAFEDYVRFGKGSDNLNKGMSEFRTSQSGQNTSTTTGGYLIPTYMGDKVIKALYQFSPIRNWATVYTTAGAGDIKFPTIDDTSNKGRILAEETQATQTLLAFGQKTLGANLFHSDIVPVSYQLLEDAAFNIEQLVVEMLAARVARGEDYYYILGNGSGQPHGVEHAVTTEGAYFAKSAITRLTILDLIHSIDAAYRQSPKCAFLFNDSTLKVIKKLSVSSTDDRSLWQPSLTAGAPDTIEGFQYFINPNVDAFGTHDNKPIFFGDWSQFYIRDVHGFQMQVFNERFADFLQRGFQLWHRTDSELMNTSAIKYGVCAAT
jgi:HK97 family phage major capsid protein